MKGLQHTANFSKDSTGVITDYGLEQHSTLYKIDLVHECTNHLIDLR